MKIQKILKSKVTKNAGWLIGGRVYHMALAFVVGLLTARYLGPGNYGLINYAATYTAFFSSFCTLGINSVIVKNFVDHPEEEGETIGSAIILRAISSAGHDGVHHADRGSGRDHDPLGRGTLRGRRSLSGDGHA